MHFNILVSSDRNFNGLLLLLLLLLLLFFFFFFFFFDKCDAATWGFFLEGDWGPPGSENFACPPQPLPSPLFDQRLFPPTEFCPPKFQKFYLILLSILTTF